MFVNIELKGPMSPEFKDRYNFRLAAEKVYDLVIKYNMHEKFLISSFNVNILREVEIVRARHTHGTYPRFDVIYLLNYEN